MSGDLIARIAAGPFIAACLVLAFAGVAKIRRPSGTTAAARAIGLPASPTLVRGLGVVETIVAAAGIAVGAGAAFAVAGLYLGLGMVAGILVRRAPGTNCGCLGTSDAPISVSHVVVDGAAVVASLFAAFGGSPLAGAGNNIWVRLAFLAATGCCAWLAGQLLDALPALNRAARPRGAA
jgi:hypothetical protein